jgi:AhpD family alkylhydroperoxidase
MSRVHSLSREDAASAAQQPLWDRLEAERKVPTANIFRALANAPVLLDAFLSYANALRDGSQLSPKLRELAILVVGHTTGSEYEIAHHQSHGRKAGLTGEQLAAVSEFETSSEFDDAERAVMALAKESTTRVHVSDATWAAAAEHLDDQQLVELTMSIAWYNSGVRIMGLLDIELEPDYRT